MIIQNIGTPWVVTTIILEFQEGQLLISQSSSQTTDISK